MKAGWWDRDGFHEGVMPAVDFASVRDSVVNPDGSVRGIDRAPSPHWTNHASPGATGDRKQEGADIRLQPTQGSRVAGGSASPSPSLGNRQPNQEAGHDG